MKLEESKKISVGDIYYVQSRYDCKSCFKVQVVEIIDDKTVLVKGMTKSKNGKKEAPPFKLSVNSMHKTLDKAVSGYRQHHK